MIEGILEGRGAGREEGVVDGVGGNSKRSLKWSSEWCIKEKLFRRGRG